MAVILLAGYDIPRPVYRTARQGRARAFVVHRKVLDRVGGRALRCRDEQPGVGHGSCARADPVDRRADRNTPIADLASALPCPVEWHHGFVLDAAELPSRPDYRGQEVVDRGLELAAGGALTPRVVGEAANTGRYDPQVLKRVWHHIARFGRPAS